MTFAQGNAHLARCAALQGLGRSVQVQKDLDKAREIAESIDNPELLAGVEQCEALLAG